MGFVGSYVWQLRQALGSQRLLVPGVGLIVTNGEGQVWLGLRTDRKEWSYIGGAMEIGQSAVDTACAEMEEEAGIVVKPEDWELVGIHTVPSENFYTYPNGDEVQIVNMLFCTTLEDELVAADEEHSEFRLFDLDDLPTPMKPGTREALAVYRDFVRSGKAQVR